MSYPINRIIRLTLPDKTDELNKEQHRNKTCIMLNACLFDPTPQNYYSCPQCPKAGDRICETCFLLCHQHGIEKKESRLSESDPKLLTVFDNCCSCAINQHQVEEGTKNEGEEQEATCCFIRASSLLNISVYAEINRKKYCYGCATRCYENAKEIKIIRGDLARCECERCLKDKKGKIVEILVRLFENHKTEENINSRSYFNLIIQQSELFDMFIRPLKELFKYFSEGASLAVLNEHFTTNEKYLKLIKNLIKIYSNDSFEFFTKETVQVFKSKINFSMKDIFKCFQSLDKIQNDNLNGSETENALEKLNAFKYYTLYFLRKLLVIPATKIKRLFDTSNSLENVTPFHRLFLKITHNQFTSALSEFGLDDKFLAGILRSLGQNPKFYSRTYSYLLIIEYMKWSILVASLQFDNWDKKLQLMSIILNKMNSINTAFKEKLFLNDMDRKIQINKYFQKFFVALLLSYNDTSFKHYIEKQSEQDNTEINEELIEQTKEFFIFCKGRQQENLIGIFQSLFFSDKDDLRIDSSLYDLLLLPEDDYIIPLKNFISSKQKYPDKFLSILDTEIVEHYGKELTNCVTFIIESQKTKNYYYNSSLGVGTFIEQIERQLCQAVNCAKSFKTASTQNKFNESNLLQLAAVKLGFFDTLLSLYNMLNTDMYIQKFIDLEAIALLKANPNAKVPDLAAIRQKILDIFQLFFDNTFLFPFFFSPGTLKIISVYDLSTKKHTFTAEHLEFYKALLLKIRQMKSKFDFSRFVTIMLNTSLSDDDFDKVNLLLKTLKLILKINSLHTLKRITCMICEYLTKEEYETFLNPNSFFKEKEPKQLIIINILKLINYMHDYYYSIFQEQFPIKNIDKLLGTIIGMLKSLDKGSTFSPLVSKEYRVFSYTYAKYYIISPFFLHTESIIPLVIPKKNPNENGNNIARDEQDYFWIKSFIETRKRYKEVDIESNEISPIKETMIKDKGGYNELNTVLEPMFINFQSFRFYLDKIKDNDKGIFRSFEKIILLPSVFMTYRILYFSEGVSANMKYLAYKTICLFLTCYHYFLQIVIDKLLASRINKDMLKKIEQAQENKKKRKIKISNDEGLDEVLAKPQNKTLATWIVEMFILEDKQEDIKIYLQNISDCLEIDLKEIKKEPLNVTLLLTKFTKYTALLKKTRFLPKLEDREEIFFRFDKGIKDSFKNEKKNSQEIEEKKVEEDEEQKFKDKITNFISLYKEAKEDYDENILLDLFESPKIDQADFFESLLHDISVKCVEKEQKDFYMEKYFSYFKSFNLISLRNPDLTQQYFLKQENLDEILNQVTQQLKVVFQFLFIDFHKLSYKKQKPGLYSSLESFTDLVEFLRLLCENHNQRFQLLLSRKTFETNFSQAHMKRDSISSARMSLTNYEKRMTLLQFLLQILPLVQDHFKNYKDRSSCSQYFKISEYEYFEPLICKVTDYLIELIQGSKSANLFRVSNPYAQRYFFSAIQALDSFKTPSNLFYLSEFLRFIVGYLEENSANPSNKNEIINQFNPNEIVFLFIYCTKKLYKRIPEVKKIEETYLKTNQGDDNHEKNTTLQGSLLEYNKVLLKAYLNSPDYFSESRYFNIARSASKYLLLATQYSNSSKVAKILVEFQTEDNENEQADITQTLDKYGHWKKQAFKFFNHIMKEVEVSQEFHYFDYNKHDELIELPPERKMLKNIFFVHPDVLLLGNEDLIKFKDDAPYEDENKKLTDLIKYLPKLKQRIELKKELNKYGDALFLFLSSLNYNTVLKISAFISLCVNAILIIANLYVKVIQNTGGTPSEIMVLQENYSHIVLYAGIGHLFFLFLVFINWFYFRIFTLKNAKKIDKIEIPQLLSSFFMGNMFLLFWNFFWGLLAALHPIFHFAYSLQLFSIFGLFETMMTVLVSVQMRYKQFLSVGLLILIFSLFFSSIKYYLYCDPTLEECNRFMYCFFNMITGGIRAGSGLNLEMKSITDPGYFNEFFIEWLFYFSIILVMLNVINSIIVDTFQEQREKANNRNDSKENVCYICNTNRTYFEKNGIDYDHHIEVTHSLQNYFQYCLTILKTSKQDLNSLDYSILEQIQNNQTGFFPLEKKEEDEGEEGDDEGKGEEDDDEREEQDEDDLGEVDEIGEEEEENAEVTSEDIDEVDDDNNNNKKKHSVNLIEEEIMTTTPVKKINK